MNTEAKTPQLPPIIGLTGAAGSGKDTVAEIICGAAPYCHLSFAEPIRAMLRALMRYAEESPDYMSKRDLKEIHIPGIGASYRHLAQTLGTEWGRHQVPGLWINVASARMADIKGQNDIFGADYPARFVISDVRFQDEAAFIRQRGGVIWRVVRPGTEPVRQHISEAGALTIEPDAIVPNAGTQAELRAQVADLLQQFTR